MSEQELNEFIASCKSAYEPRIENEEPHEVYAEPDEQENHKEEPEQQPQDYFEQQQQSINKTKKKLQELLEKLQAQPEKETIKKKILRIKINRLRNVLSREMEKFDIEFQADQQESVEYEKFVEKYNMIKQNIDKLRDREDELLYALEYYTKRENYRGNIDRNMSTQMRELAPRTKQGTTRVVKSTPKKGRTAEIKAVLFQLQDKIGNLEEELNNSMSDYREYKESLQEETEQKIDKRFAELKEEEKARKQQQKNELALANPSIWTTIKNSIRTAKDKFVKWVENRKQRKAEANNKVNSENVQLADELISKKTARESFKESVEADEQTKRNIARVAAATLDENNKTKNQDKEQQEQQGQEHEQ